MMLFIALNDNTCKVNYLNQNDCCKISWGFFSGLVDSNVTYEHRTLRQFHKIKEGVSDVKPLKGLRKLQATDFRRVWSVCVQVAGRYHARVFVDWRRGHQIVTLVLPPPTQAVVAVDSRPRPASADKLSPSIGTTAAVFVAPRDSLPADVVRCLVDCRPRLYWRCRTSGRWRFGRLPTTSVSDTAACGSTLHAVGNT